MAEDILCIKNLSFSYKENEIFKSVNLCIPKGETHIIIGQSGAGKTTLLKIMAGIINPTTGSVKAFDKSVFDKDFNRSIIGYIPQDLGLVKNSSAMKNILLGSLNRVKFSNSIIDFPENEKKEVVKIAKSLGIEKLLEKKVSTLSGGEKRRVAIARALLAHPKIILADEFVSDLDYNSVKEIMSILDNLKKKYSITIVIVDHHLEYVKKFADKVSLVKKSMCFNLGKDDLKNIM